MSHVTEFGEHKLKKNSEGEATLKITIKSKINVEKKTRTIMHSKNQLIKYFEVFLLLIYNTYVQEYYNNTKHDTKAKTKTKHRRQRQIEKTHSTNFISNTHQKYKKIKNINIEINKYQESVNVVSVLVDWLAVTEDAYSYESHADPENISYQNKKVRRKKCFWSLFLKDLFFRIRPPV